MRVWREEVFAPVLPVVTYSSDTEAVALANDTDYGLGSHIYCTDEAHASALTAALDTAMISVNGSIYTRPWNPFGGVKCSGFGSEHGIWGYHELTIPRVVATAN